MGTTHQSPFEIGFALSMPGRKILDIGREDPTHRNRNQNRPAKLSALEEVLQWQLAEPVGSQKFLESLWKTAAERVSGAAMDAQKPATARDLPIDSSGALSDSLPAIKMSLAESRAGIHETNRLPHVNSGEWASPVPRCFALADVYLRFAGFEFEERRFARFVSAVQKSVSLKMSEIWNLKPCLELVLLRSDRKGRGSHHAWRRIKGPSAKPCRERPARPPVLLLE